MFTFYICEYTSIFRTETFAWVLKDGWDEDHTLAAIGDHFLCVIQWHIISDWSTGTWAQRQIWFIAGSGNKNMTQISAGGSTEQHCTKMSLCEICSKLTRDHNFYSYLHWSFYLIEVISTVETVVSVWQVYCSSCMAVFLYALRVSLGNNNERCYLLLLSPARQL